MNTISPEFRAALRDATIIAPEMPQADAYETLEAIKQYEREFTATLNEAGPTEHDYEAGSAQYDDQVALYGPTGGRVVVSADHATASFKKSIQSYLGADHGTGGLAMLLSEREHARSVVPTGRQTGNVAASPDTHPIKVAIGATLPGAQGFLSLHGMEPGKFLQVDDGTEIHALIGLGQDTDGHQPNEDSRALAEKLVAIGKSLDLRVLIGNDTKFYKSDPDTGAVITEAGIPVQGQLKAHRVDMTTNYAYRVMERTGQQIPSAQLEMTRLLRLLPIDFEGGWHIDKKARAIGVHLGYLLASAAVKAMTGTEQDG